MENRVASSFSRCNLFQLPLEPTNAHGGEGDIHFHRIATAANLAGNCNFIDFTSMPPGTTIGKHCHRADEEEFYLILQGTGTMQLGDEHFPVQAGDLIRNPPGGTHALQNTGDHELQMFVFEVKVDEPETE